MNEHELSSRLDRLERENRRWKRIVVAVAGSVAVLGVLAMATPVCDVITGERLVLRDPMGRARLTLDAYHLKDGPDIVWSDKDGRKVARIALENDGIARVTYFDPDGKARASERVGGEAPKTDGTKKDGAPTVVKN